MWIEVEVRLWIAKFEGIIKLGDLFRFLFFTYWLISLHRVFLFLFSLNFKCGLSLGSFQDEIVYWDGIGMNNNIDRGEISILISQNDRDLDVGSHSRFFISSIRGVTNLKTNRIKKANKFEFFCAPASHF